MPGALAHLPGELAPQPGELAHSCNPSYREARTARWFEV